MNDLMEVWDEYGCMNNNYIAAIAVHLMLMNQSSVAVPINVGGGTMFYFIFTNLNKAIPDNAVFANGSARGIQISIDRIGSYGIPRGQEIGHFGSIMSNWGLGEYEARALLPFFNTVLTGKNHFEGHDE